MFTGEDLYIYILNKSWIEVRELSGKITPAPYSCHAGMRDQETGAGMRNGGFYFPNYGVACKGTRTKTKPTRAQNTG